MLAQIIGNFWLTKLSKCSDKHISYVDMEAKHKVIEKTMGIEAEDLGSFPNYTIDDEELLKQFCSL